MCTQSIFPCRRNESVMPLRLSPTTPYMRLTPATTSISAIWSATFLLLDAPVSVGVQSATRRTACRQFEKASLRSTDARKCGTDLLGPAGPFLADGERHRIHEMRTSDLDHTHPLVRLVLYGRCQRRGLRQKALLQFDHRGDVRRSWECIVR